MEKTDTRGAGAGGRKSAVLLRRQRGTTMRIIKSGQFALVIDTNERADISHPGAAPSGAGLCGHFVFDRYAVDNNGFIRLTATLPLSELQGCLDIFGAELESLLRQAHARYGEPAPEDHEFHRAAAD
jgi:hypothetical protein